MSINQLNGNARRVENDCPPLSIKPWITQCLDRIETLSNREQEVLRLLGSGLENRAVAATLGISQKAQAGSVGAETLRTSCHTTSRSPHFQ